MKSKIIYKFFSICLATIFFLYLGGSNSWAYDYDYDYNYIYNYDYDYDFPFPYIYDSDPNITTGSDGIVPTLLKYSVEKIIIRFFSYPYPMKPDATKDAFHFYEDETNDITGNGELDLDNTGDYSTLTFTPSPSLQEGVDYKVRIDYTAQDTTGRTIDGNRNGEIEEGELDNWEMMFKFEIDEGSSPVIGWSQVYDLDNIFSENSENIVSAMVVDNQDGLWVGSKEGDVCYFDGNDWNCEKPFESIIYSTYDIPCMVVDNEGVLWVGLNIEDPQDDSNTPMLAKLENNTWHIISVKDLNIILPGFIKDMAVDSENNIWMITDTSGVLRYNYITGEVINYPSPDGYAPKEFMKSLMIDNDDNVWIGTVNCGIWKVDAQSGFWDDQYALQDDFSSGVIINTMVADSSGNIWVGTNNGLLLKLNPSASGGEPIWLEYPSANGLPGDCINTLRIDSNNALIWVGTSSGLGKFDISDVGYGTAYSYTGDQASEISDIAINHLAINTRGEVWFGTEQGIQMRDEILPYVLESESFPPDEAVIDTAQDIRIVFSEPMNHEITESAFSIIKVEDNQSIMGELFWQDSQTLVLVPDSMVVNQSYMVEIDTPAEDLLGNTLSEPYQVLFTITEPLEKDSPYITNKSCSLKELIFNIKDDGEGVDPNSVVVVVEGGVDSSLISGVPHINGTSDNYKIKFLPDQNFSKNTMITVYVKASDLAGNELEVDFQIQAKSTSGGDSQYSPNYWLYPYNKMYQYNNMYTGMYGLAMYGSAMYGGAQISSNYQTPGNFQKYSPLQPYNIYPTSVNSQNQPVNYQNQVAMQQWPSCNFSFPFDQFCAGLLQTWYQKLLLTWSHPFNRQAYMFTNSQLRPYTYTSPNFLLQSFYQPQYQSWNSIGRQGQSFYHPQYHCWNSIDIREQSFENYQVKSYEGIAIQSKQSLPTISQKQQPQGQVSQFNQQPYKPAITQSTSLHQSQSQGSQFIQQSYKPPIIQSTSSHQPQYQKNQTWNLKESQQQQTLNLQKHQQLMNVQQQKSWTQTFKPYYR